MINIGRVPESEGKLAVELNRILGQLEEQINIELRKIKAEIEEAE